MLLNTKAGTVWLAPFCFVHEVVNLLLRQERRGAVKLGVVEAMLDELMAGQVELQPPPDELKTRSAIQLARKHGVSLYDGFYLDLTVRSGATLATRDGLLVVAAKFEGCAVEDARGTP